MELDTNKLTEDPDFKVTYKDVAYRIFNEFIMLQSTTVKGLEQDADGTIVSIAEKVIKELERLDLKHNCYKAGDGRTRRYAKKPANTIGGYTAHKQFKFARETRAGVPVVTIWRVQ